MTAGEFILPVAATNRLRAIGGEGLLESLRRGMPGVAVPAGGMLSHASGGPIRGYADGGLVGTVAKFLTNPVGAIGDFIHDRMADIGNNKFAQAGLGAVRKMADGLVNMIKGTFSNGVGTAQNLGGDPVDRRGHLLDKTTAAIFDKASQVMSLFLMQGSWSNSVGASGGTHSGAGAMDVWPANGDWKAAVDLIRGLGGIAWHRTPAQGNWAEHIHSITPGVPGLSANAQAQVSNFRSGYNGLVGNGPDNHGYWSGGLIGAANGMKNWQGGMLLVGENGPEFVDIPYGANIYNTNISGSMANGLSRANSNFARRPNLGPVSSNLGSNYQNPFTSEDAGPNVHISVKVDAPQNMNPSEVGTMVARRIGYAYASHVTPFIEAVGS